MLPTIGVLLAACITLGVYGIVAALTKQPGKYEYLKDEVVGVKEWCFESYP